MDYTVYKVIGLISELYDRYWCTITGAALIIGGLIPMILLRDCTFAVLAFLIGIPMLFMKEEK